VSELQRRGAARAASRAEAKAKVEAHLAARKAEAAGERFDAWLRESGASGVRLFAKATGAEHVGRAPLGGVGGDSTAGDVREAALRVPGLWPHEGRPPRLVVCGRLLRSDSQPVVDVLPDPKTVRKGETLELVVLLT